MCASGLTACLLRSSWRYAVGKQFNTDNPAAAARTHCQHIQLFRPFLCSPFTSFSACCYAVPVAGGLGPRSMCASCSRRTSCWRPSGWVRQSCCGR